MQRVGVSETTPQTGAGRPSWVGTWGIWGGHKYEFPWLKGSVVSCNWADIEPQPNQYNFYCIDSRIQEAVDNNQYVIFKVYVGNEPHPEWIWDKVPRVVTDRGRTYPYYLDTYYKMYVKRLWAALLKHVTTLPSAQRVAIIGMQVPMGKSGDMGPYDGTPLSEYADYAIDPEGSDWGGYQREMITAWLEARDALGLTLIPLFNVQQGTYTWMKGQGIKHMLKSKTVAQMFQMNNEMSLDWVRQLLHEPVGSDFVRGRGELDTAVNDEAGWFFEAPLWNYYWQSLWMLTYGIDIFNQRTETLKEGARYAYPFTFFTSHAGYKNPRTARYAYVALRDGLDQADTTRFPESIYGTYSGVNSPLRYQRITNAFSDFGAKQGDVVHQASTSLELAKELDKMNDVGYKIWPGNYGKYLDQINPNGTSQGYWRVGSTSQPYGRYARGFNTDEGMNRMYFNVDDRMFDAGGLAGKEQIQIRVVYFDKGTGTWALRYDATSSNDKLARLVTNTNTNTWKEETITVTDAYFNNRGPNGSDISLVNTDTADDIFHMIEITFVGR
jgi:hypothetical protein